MEVRENPATAKSFGSCWLYSYIVSSFCGFTSLLLQSFITKVGPTRLFSLFSYSSLHRLITAATPPVCCSNSDESSSNLICCKFSADVSCIGKGNTEIFASEYFAVFYTSGFDIIIYQPKRYPNIHFFRLVYNSSRHFAQFWNWTNCFGDQPMLWRSPEWYSRQLNRNDNCWHCFEKCEPMRIQYFWIDMMVVRTWDGTKLSIGWLVEQLAPGPWHGLRRWGISLSPTRIPAGGCSTEFVFANCVSHCFDNSSGICKQSRLVCGINLNS